MAPHGDSLAIQRHLVIMGVCGLVAGSGRRGRWPGGGSLPGGGGPSGRGNDRGYAGLAGRRSLALGEHRNGKSRQGTL